MNCVFLGGMLVDGTGGPPVRADLRVKDGKIHRIAQTLKPEPGETAMDITGAWLAPGFIDCHTHSDLAAMQDGGLDAKILQGVTTEVTGQCGLSVFPLPSERRETWRAISVIGNPPFAWGWGSAHEWLTALAARPLEANVLPFIGAGTLRYGLVGDDPAPLDAGQMLRYQAALEEAFASGIAGISFGLIYVPAIFSTRDELELAALTAARFGRPLAVHLRSESDELEAALREMLELAKKTGVHLHLSHLKAIGFKNRPQLDAVLAMVDRAGIGFDHYPYPWGSTSLLSLIPPHMMRDGVTHLLERLGDLSVQNELEGGWSGGRALEQGAPWDNLPALVGWKNIRIVHAAHGAADDCRGFPVNEAAALRGCSPSALVCQVLRDARGDARMIDEYMEEEAVVQILRHPAGMIASDSLFGPGAHPRVSGCFPRVFERYVFDRPVLRLEEAVRKMTGATADWLGLEERGLLREGLAADLVVFTGEIAEPVPGSAPPGIRLVMINGEVVARDGKRVYGKPSGMILRANEKNDPLH